MKSSEFNDIQKDRVIKSINKHSSGCWIWGKSIRNGYGQISMNGKVTYAHRVAYAMFKGDIPEGLFVRHSNNCISRACCNPDHLTLGTNADNMQDVRNAGYDKVVTGKGEEHYNAKLNEQAVADIRDEIRAGARPIDLVDKYGISISVICKVARGESWGHVPGAITEDELPSLAMKLRKPDVISIRQRVWNGESASAIAKEFDVDISVITDVTIGKTWENVPGALQEDFFKQQNEIIGARGWRVCLKCMEIKDLHLFVKNKSSRNGYGSKCKSCDNARYRKSMV